MPIHGKRVHGAPIVTEASVTLMTPEELFIWEILYQTIVDCHMVGTGQWRHFCRMRWYSRDGAAAATLAKAREYTTGWIESDAFADYVKVMGWNPEWAVNGCRSLLNGEKDPAEIKRYLHLIAKQRDERRVRGELQYG